MLRALISLLAGSCLFAVAAPTSSIGVIRSSGVFCLDGSNVRNNSTLFDGALVETTAARSVLQLDAGEVTLAPDSRAKVYRDHTVLEKGAALLRDADKHEFQAASLQIVPATRDSVVQVDVEGPGRIAVAARNGSAFVRNSSGVLIASLQPGMELAFNAAQQGTTAVDITGVLQVRNGNYYITDPNTHVTIQVQGTDLAQYVGKKVEITGSQVPGATPAAGATEVVQVTSITPETKRRRPVAVYAVVGGVVVGGTLIGLAAAGAFHGQVSMSPQ
jgi:hypothetical protein